MCVPTLAPQEKQVTILAMSVLLLFFSLILFKAAHTLKKEENPAICDNMEEPGGCYAK